MRWILPICALALLSCDDDSAVVGGNAGMNVVGGGEGQGGDDGGGATAGEGEGEGQGPAQLDGQGGEGEGEPDDGPEPSGLGEGEGEGEVAGAGEGEVAGEGEGEASGEGEGEGAGPVVVGECAVEADGACVREVRLTSDQLCERYVRDYPSRADTPIWSAEAEECSAGDLTGDARADALRRINLYRWMAGLGEVVDAPELNASVQECALMQSTAGALDHFPPEGWACWTAAGAAEAGRSNLSIGQTTAGGAVDSQMIDAGEANEQVLGHRRWLLFGPLEEVAVGYAHTGERPATCVHVVPEPFTPNELQGLDGLVTWPPAGVAPFELVHPPNARGNALRWSVVAANVDFAGATARMFVESTPGEVSDDDEEVVTQVGRLRELLEDGLWIAPDGPIEPGATYRVEVSGASVGNFAWRTTFAPCGLVVPELCDPVAQDCPLPGTGCYGLDGPACKDTALPQGGEACVFDRQCPRGTTCAQWPDDGNLCSAYCSTRDDAPEGLDCGTVCPQGVHVIDADQGWAICRPPA